MSYREPLFQVGTVQNEGESYETTQYLSVDDDMGKANTPHITIDSWGDLDGNGKQLRIWLNRKQWAELAEFAATMAEDERIPVGDERMDVQYFDQEALAQRIREARRVALEKKQQEAIAYMQRRMDDGSTWFSMSYSGFEKRVLDSLVDEGYAETREVKGFKGRDITEYSLTFKGQKRSKGVA